MTLPLRALTCRHFRRQRGADATSSLLLRGALATALAAALAAALATALAAALATSPPHWPPPSQPHWPPHWPPASQPHSLLPSHRRRHRRDDVLHHFSTCQLDVDGAVRMHSHHGAQAGARAEEGGREKGG